MQNNPHIVIVAGEESGDQHAARLIHDLKSKIPNLNVTGIGGHHLANEGVTLLSDLAQYGITGIGNILSHARVIKDAFKKIKAHLKAHKPDLLILVDYPGFNLRLAKFAKQELGIKVLYYISPQIWAWKAGRIHTIKQNVDHMAVILPFEKNIYDKAGVEASFVGHPLIEKIKNVPDLLKARQALSISSNALIMGLLPGSRKGEIQLLLPILFKAAQKIHAIYPHVQFVIPIAESLTDTFVKKFWDTQKVPATFIRSQALLVMSASNAVVVASGTASLECALLQKPMCIIYKASTLSFVIGYRLIKVRFLGLCNLLMNKMIVPELLQDDCRVDTLFAQMNMLISDTDACQRMQNRLSTLYHSLTDEARDCSIDELTYQLLINNDRNKSN